MTNIEIGCRIADRRKELDITMEDLAGMIGVAKSTIQRYETGKIVKIKMPVIESIAHALRVNPCWLIGKTDEKQASPALPQNIIPMPEVKKIPLLGSIACGQPILAEEHIEDYIDVPRHISADFALTCKGDSMAGARIFDGDVVYIRRQDTVENGEIAAVLIDNEATLKRVHIYDDHIVLSPENPMYKPMSYWDEAMNEVRILGKAIAFTSLVW